MAQIPQEKAMNPILAILCWISYFLMGQKDKGIKQFILSIIGYCCCYLPGLVITLSQLIDAWKCANAMKAGEPLDEHEYKFELLYKMSKWLHKDAIFNG